MGDRHTVPMELHDHAAQFADDLTDRIQRVLPTDIQFTALTRAGRKGSLVSAISRRTGSYHYRS